MTKTDIANLALSKIGESLITSITDTSDKASRLSLLHYDQALREILRSHFWGFAMSTVSLSKVSSPAAVDILGWGAAFAIPSTFIKLRSLRTTDGAKIDKFDFRRVGDVRAIVSGNFDAVIFDHVKYLDDPTQYDPLFIAALVTLLASKLARAISGTEQMETALRQTYENLDLPNARTADGHDSQSNENHPLRDMLEGSLTGPRGDFFPETD